MEDKKSAGLNEQISSPVNYDSKKDVQSPEKTAGEIEKAKKELEDFKKKVVKKFPFIHSLSVLPAQSSKMFEEEEGLLPEDIKKKPTHLMMLIPEDQFKNVSKKIRPEMIKLANESKQPLWIHIKTEVDVWNYGLDSKYEFVDAVGMSYPLYDKGLLSSLRVASIHKNLVLRKFEKYVASYVVGGSLIRGTADKDSDVDTFVIIDDTDVKRMPRLQLLDKLRGIIHDYIREATALAGVKNILNVQVWLLTDFWERVKDAESIAYTFIRDGVPMYDRGTFLPWKLLLKMGKIKPSPEAVDKFMKVGEQNEPIVKRKMIDAMVDIYYGVITPAQALMMLTGNETPAPKEMVAAVRKILVEKEKVMSQKDLKFLESVIKLYKDHEHGKLKNFSGKNLDELLKESGEYNKRLKESRKKLETKLISDDALRIYDEVFDLLKKEFGNKGRESLVEEFETELVKKGKIQRRYLPVLKNIIKIKQKVRGGKVSHTEMDNVKKMTAELIRELVDYSQRKELISMEKGLIQVSFGNKRGELVLTDSCAFFVEGDRIMKVGLKGFTISTQKDFEKAITNTKDRMKVKLDSKVLEILKKELGDFELNI